MPKTTHGNPSPPSAKSTGSVMEYWLQEQRPQGWLDLARKDSFEIAVARLAELANERPRTDFRVIIRRITDVVVSPNETWKAHLEKQKDLNHENRELYQQLSSMANSSSSLEGWLQAELKKSKELLEKFAHKD